MINVQEGHDDSVLQGWQCDQLGQHKSAKCGV